MDVGEPLTPEPEIFRSNLHFARGPFILKVVDFVFNMDVDDSSIRFEFSSRLVLEADVDDSFILEFEIYPCDLVRLTHYDTPSSTTHYYTRLAQISHTRTHTNIHSKKKDSRQRWKIRDSQSKKGINGDNIVTQLTCTNITQNKGNIII